MIGPICSWARKFDFGYVLPIKHKHYENLETSNPHYASLALSKARAKHPAKGLRHKGFTGSRAATNQLVRRPRGLSSLYKLFASAKGTTAHTRGSHTPLKQASRRFAETNLNEVGSRKATALQLRTQVTTQRRAAMVALRALVKLREPKSTRATKLLPLLV